MGFRGTLGGGRERAEDCLGGAGGSRVWGTQWVLPELREGGLSSCEHSLRQELGLGAQRDEGPGPVLPEPVASQILPAASSFAPQGLHLLSPRSSVLPPALVMFTAGSGGHGNEAFPFVPKLQFPALSARLGCPARLTSHPVF